MQLMQKTYPFSVQIEMPLANALKSVGYTDVIFVTIGKLDIVSVKKFRFAGNRFLSG
jgi:hypothetical protein